ncbi:hypothetical protein CYMTET_4003 [Cymbomonas tetramitiformis]|uniref:Uncharacterized protein n=1 Tax=Cymbomonas tetramitiformis TaxID=36881 RepID=A0AAE0LKI1_9CHLO|nr:hypothetical protein CYMTET_4003 [Cymbomonas tetramitiformis]
MLPLSNELGTKWGSGNLYLLVGYYELNYTTATLFKSAKVVTVMIVSSLFGRTVSSKAIVLALVLCLGLSVFGIADKMAAPRFSLWGVTANLLSLIVTAFTSNLQDRVLKASTGGTAKAKEDLMLFQYSVASLGAVVWRRS